MKAYLMFNDRDFDLKGPQRTNQDFLVQDLELDLLFNAMAGGDKFLMEVVTKALLSDAPMTVDRVLYRQAILKDCIKNPSIVREIYQLALEAIEKEKKAYFGFFCKFPDSILSRSIEVLQLFSDTLKRLRALSETYGAQFDSEGFQTLFAMLQKELSDAYFLEIQNHLRVLKFRDGVWISAELGQANKGTNYVLRKPPENHSNWFDRLFTIQPPEFSYTIADRDEAGSRALSELRERGINLVANALAQSCDHILNFLVLLRTELAFYLGCMNLYEQLGQMGEPATFPIPARSEERELSFEGLYDMCLALNLQQKVIGNDLEADQKDLFIITGANQGGKSTFLRSIGLAQLMMQNGMFVPAISYRANLCEGLFTHFKREEDTTMKSGKLDEELSRMNTIAERLSEHAMVLFNESFAATNEREGSEIARQIVRALVERKVKVFFVTHLFDFAQSMFEESLLASIFLRADRQTDGGRTFKLYEGEPLQTSFGLDVYQRVFASRADRD